MATPSDLPIRKPSFSDTAGRCIQRLTPSFHVSQALAVTGEPAARRRPAAAAWPTVLMLINHDHHRSVESVASNIRTDAHGAARPRHTWIPVFDRESTREVRDSNGPPLAKRRRAFRIGRSDAGRQRMVWASNHFSPEIRGRVANCGSGGRASPVLFPTTLIWGYSRRSGCRDQEVRSELLGRQELQPAPPPGNTVFISIHTLTSNGVCCPKPFRPLIESGVSLVDGYANTGWRD